MKPVLAALVFAAAGSLTVLAAEPSSDLRTVKLRTGVDNAMKFDVTSITAAPGEKLRIVITNATTLPKSVMGHNWVLLAAGADTAAFAAAAAPEAGSGYVPEKLKDKVLAVVPVLGPNETGEVTIQAPAEPGEYPFLCSFPGHCLIGMKGTLVVKK